MSLFLACCFWAPWLQGACVRRLCWLRNKAQQQGFLWLLLLPLSFGKTGLLRVSHDHSCWRLSAMANFWKLCRLHQLVDTKHIRVLSDGKTFFVTWCLWRIGCHLKIYLETRCCLMTFFATFIWNDWCFTRANQASRDICILDRDNAWGP